MVSAQAVRWACDRLDDFMAIHPTDDLDGPVDLLIEGYGLDREMLTGFLAWTIEHEIPEERQVDLLFGVLIGVIASEHRT